MLFKSKGGRGGVGESTNINNRRAASSVSMIKLDMVQKLIELLQSK
jgi:hypothetical protein